MKGVVEKKKKLRCQLRNVFTSHGVVVVVINCVGAVS